MAFNYLYNNKETSSVFKDTKKEIVIDDKMATDMQRLVNSTKIDKKTKIFYIDVLKRKVEGRDLTMSYDPKNPGGGVDFLNTNTGGWTSSSSHPQGVLAMRDAYAGIEKQGQEGNLLAPEDPGFDKFKLDEDTAKLLRSQIDSGAIKGDQANYVNWLLKGKKRGKDLDVTIGKDFKNRQIYYQGAGGQQGNKLAPEGTSDIIYGAIDQINTQRAKREEAINTPIQPLSQVGAIEHLTKQGAGQNKTWEQLVKPPPVKPIPSSAQDAKLTTTKDKTKRAASVGKSKLSSYDKVWKANKSGVQQKYKNKAEFVKAAEAWWAKKDL